MRVGLVWKCCSNSLFRTSSDMGSLPSVRSEEHTSELQSQSNLVCRLLLEKKKTLYAQNVLFPISKILIERTLVAYPMTFIMVTNIHSSPTRLIFLSVFAIEDGRGVVCVAS